MSISLIKKACTLGIHLFCLPPNTTHVLQPLDVGVFGPMKQRWRTILKSHKLKTKATNITKEVFLSLIKQLWERGITAEHLQGGFRAAGLVPFNLKAVKSSQLAPSLVAERLSAEQTTEGEFTATLTLHHCETPIRAELCGYFREVLKPAEGQQKTKRRCRVELSCVGEVLTNDEVVERIERVMQREPQKRRAVERKECTS